ncbi:hypothetical protein [Arthrobacter glacialis]|nr:hypothetical protein [Arthrobacter glacialis]
MSSSTISPIFAPRATHPHFMYQDLCVQPKRGATAAVAGSWSR